LAPSSENAPDPHYQPDPPIWFEMHEEFFVLLEELHKQVLQRLFLQHVEEDFGGISPFAGIW
jgi:hypothetical protein